MNTAIPKEKKNLVQACLISSVLVGFSFFLQGTIGFNLADEGFLWYGAQRVALGDVPFRDFMSYDPGRYYWTAVYMGIAGDTGIMSVRIAAAVFQALGLTIGLFVIAQVDKSRGAFHTLFLLICAMTLAIWMFPRHKLFDISLSLISLGALTYLVFRPVPSRFIVTGIFVGLVAVFGRNHGIYGVVASVGLIAWLAINNGGGPGFLKGGLLWGVGVTIGFLPVLLMALFIPGFASAFWESIRFLLENQATNLPLPVPWPWDISFSGSGGRILRNLLIGVFFVGLIGFPVLSIAWVTYCKIRNNPVSPALPAAAFLSLSYAHFAFSRADVGHLAQSVFPLLVGCLVLTARFRTRTKWISASALFAAGIWIMISLQPVWLCIKEGSCVSATLAGDELLVNRGVAQNLSLIEDLATRFAPDGETFYVAPFWPGAYAIMEREAPEWEIYAWSPRPEAFEKREIERLRQAAPRFAVITDVALDGREELRFKNTHPLTFAYIEENFDLLPGLSLKHRQVYKYKDEK